MRIVFWASALLLVTISFAATQGPVAVATGSSIGSKTRLEIRTRTGASYIVIVERDSTVSPKVEPSDITIVGEVQGSFVILIDTYPSIPGGLSYCQAGQERFLRVISISRKPPGETMRFKLASCRDNIELASPGVEWLPGSSTLRIHWLLGPNTRQKPEELSIRIGSDAKPAARHPGRN